MTSSVARRIFGSGCREPFPEEEAEVQARLERKRAKLQTAEGAPPASNTETPEAAAEPSAHDEDMENIGAEALTPRTTMFEML